MLSRLLVAFAALALCLPQPGFAQSGLYSGSNSKVHMIGPSQGGAVGISVDTVTYRCGSYTCVKVIGFDRTNFTGLQVGDYIVMVNQITFSTVDQFFGLIRENAPGTRVTIDYWDASNGNSSMYQTAALRAGTGAGSTADLVVQLETILRADAQFWEVSNYHRNSLRDVRVSQPSSGGSYVASGRYTYDGAFTSNNVDTVEFHFRGPSLTCIKYGGESCRAVRSENPNVLGTVIVAAAAAVAVAAIADGVGGSSPARQSGGGYRGETRGQCQERCSQYPGDSNPNVEAAYIAQCRQRCASLPAY
jgi:hypothetical protein